jgi:thioredoxin-related protein
MQVCNLGNKMRRTSLLLAVSLLAAAECRACDSTDDTDYPRSVEMARKTNRPLLLAFLGTDWSMRSLKLDREVFDQAAFADDSRYNFLLCKIHFYQTQERAPDIVLQNQQLAEKYHIDEFPTVVVLSAQGAELGRVGYIPGGVDKFASAVNALIFKSRSQATPN